ncbi:MAG: AAA family ATPase [Lachnospiraceae bacterium]|nr:AAA family ATPase [Lachnospiraceae bacterium]
MKIRVAIFEKDELYLRKITAVFNKKYLDKIQIYCVTNFDLLKKILEDNKIDVLLSNEEFDINIEILPKRCGFAYLTESNEIEQWKDNIAIGKYQHIDLIYKAILNIYAEKAADLGVNKEVINNMTNIYTFVSASGGTGSSTIAAAASINVAKTGKKVLYLNLEKFGNVNVFFQAEGNGNLSEAIYAVKSRRSNLLLKLESNIKVASNGVNFFDNCKNSFDIMELTREDINLLIYHLTSSKLFDCIIIDCDFEISDMIIEILKMSSVIYFVNDGSKISNEKFMNVYNTLEIYEQQKDIRILDKITVFYNKFRNKTSTMIENNDIKIIGGIKMYDGASAEQVIEEISSMSILKDIFN